MEEIIKLVLRLVGIALLIFLFIQSYLSSNFAILVNQYLLARHLEESGSEGLENFNVTSKMNYGHFLEYLDLGWVSKVDLYDNSHMAIILASSPELGNRSQEIRVEIPAGASQLITKLREAHVDFDAHANNADNLAMSFKVFGNFVLPIFILVFAFYLFNERANRGNYGGGPGQFLNIGKSNNDFQIEKHTGITFDQVAGIEEAKEEFEEVVTFLKTPEKFNAVGAKIPRGVLLVGPPGTGKTLLAKAISGEAGVPFVSISGSEFVEMFVGVGASRVRDLFKKAKTNAPCIIFIDEIDAVGRQRGAGVGGGNDEREQTLNQLLTEMDGFEGNSSIIVVAATNRVDILDSALLRPGRFDRQITVNLPDLKARTAILNVHARKKNFETGLEIESIARRTPGFSGADLANLLNEAAILSAREQRDAIRSDHIDRTIDRIITGLEGIYLFDSNTKRLVAYHEIGHAITGTMLEYHDPVEKVTLIPRIQARGLTWFSPMEDQGLISRGQLIARITTILGGRAAEEIIFGNSEVTTGASNDIMQATSLARQMVTRFGMSNVGPMVFETQANSQIFLDGTMAGGLSITNDTATRIDKEVKEIILYCYNQALQILMDNRNALDLLSDLLIQHETIEGDEFREILIKYSPIPEKPYYVSYFEKSTN